MICTSLMLTLSGGMSAAFLFSWTKGPKLAPEVSIWICFRLFYFKSSFMNDTGVFCLLTSFVDKFWSVVSLMACCRSSITIWTCLKTCQEVVVLDKFWIFEYSEGFSFWPHMCANCWLPAAFRTPSSFRIFILVSFHLCVTLIFNLVRFFGLCRNVIASSAWWKPASVKFSHVISLKELGLSKHVLSSGLKRSK